MREKDYFLSMGDREKDRPAEGNMTREREAERGQCWA